MSGRAYAFFKSNATQSDILPRLYDSQRIAEVSPTLRLTLTGDIGQLETRYQKERPLAALVSQAKTAGMNYGIEATDASKEATNKSVASELGHVMNMLYVYGEPLWKDGDPFTGMVVYKDRAAYREAE